MHTQMKFYALYKKKIINDPLRNKNTEVEVGKNKY